MRIIYTFLLFFALPLVFLRLLWKSRRQPAYRRRMAERMGFYPFKLAHCHWVHAVSMGEVIAATPLIKKLKAAYPDVPLLVTTMTPTGAEQVQKSLGDLVTHAYIPYDFPKYIDRFLRAMNPRVAVIMETELWPNTIAACHARRIPLCLLNARLSDKSARAYQRVAWLVRPMLQRIQMIAAHGEKDAERFVALGAKRKNVTVTGSIKFDLELPEQLWDQAKALRVMLGINRFVWVAGSTHEGEENIILAAHRKLCEVHPSALLVLVPRHPNRFDLVARLCEKEFVVTRRSHASEAHGEVYLADTMGEMMLFYAAADVAFVGGSLVARGGHNILEPAALRKPVLSGTSLYNFTDIGVMLMNANALVTVSDADSLAAQLLKLAVDEQYRAELGEQAWRVVNENRGALAKQLEMVKALIV